MATVPSVITHVGWHELIAPDVEPAKAFYAELLGWEIGAWRPGDDYATVRAGGRGHGGFHAIDREPHWLVYVEVKDVDAVVASVPELGGRVFHGPTAIADVGRYAVLGDPQGAVHAAIAVEEQGERPAGIFVWDELLTSDPDAARRFYGELYGWQAVDVDASYALFKVGEETVAGLMRKPDELPASAWFTYVGTDDLDRTLERAQQLGGTVAAPTMEVAGFGRWAVLVDPTGAAFGALEQQS